ncbi:DUF4271 domain-containing protein [Mangrovimonas sp. AS39]|uniref:DUF4271 domain-containing protein n=1 Tax=Mangrovimonas futianensis TaxID=2895523 RepID=UPI001E3E3D81|nr:DUF4271 domain-containing protein [Mangrovimonas futianensis]MCF1191085.1 DUF4271 domain-containing protein [Mangrovimonas futianensis]MCF1194780.1 DUF4271 domain-containing protein [Mangrovimonas futianensis]
MLRDYDTHDLFTILMVTGIILVATSKLFFERRFNQFIGIFVSSTYLKVYEKNQKFFDYFDSLLFVNLIFSLAIFIWIALNTVFEPIEISANNLLRLILAISVFILVKVLIERLVASIFNIDKLIDEYLFQKISYKNFLGILLVPINAVLLYSLTPNKTIILIVIALLFLVNLVGLITSYKSHQSLIKKEFFYFILYLCALEIGPYLILYKLFIETAKA